MLGEKTFATLELSSGTLRMLDSQIVATRRLDMFPYDAFTGGRRCSTLLRCSSGVSETDLT